MKTSESPAELSWNKNDFTRPRESRGRAHNANKGILKQAPNNRTSLSKPFVDWYIQDLILSG